MSEQQQCEIDYKAHIKDLEQELNELEARKDTWTAEDEEKFHELRRRIYRSKVRKRCC